jgi:hypothetical protein
MEIELERATVAFRAEVVEVKEGPTTRIPGINHLHKSQIGVVRVLESWKGRHERGDLVRVTTSEEDGTCATRLVTELPSSAASSENMASPLFRGEWLFMLNRSEPYRLISCSRFWPTSSLDPLRGQIQAAAFQSRRNLPSIAYARDYIRITFSSGHQRRGGASETSQISIYRHDESAHQQLELDEFFAAIRKTLETAMTPYTWRSPPALYADVVDVTIFVGSRRYNLGAGHRAGGPEIHLNTSATDRAQLAALKEILRLTAERMKSRLVGDEVQIQGRGP